MPQFRSTPIFDHRKRKIAFCKKKKDILKRLIDLSTQCNQQILLLIKDSETGGVVKYSTSQEFNFHQAAQAEEAAVLPNNKCKLERYTNEDYDDLCHADFRRSRKKKEPSQHVHYDQSAQNVSKPKSTKRLKTEKEPEMNEVLIGLNKHPELLSKIVL